MWYALYCPNQKEAEVIRLCRRVLTGPALTDAFVLTCDRMRRYEGAWHMEKRPLFPNCVFLESGDGKRLKRELEACRRTVGGEGRDGPVPVCGEEEALLRELCGKGRHLSLSRGCIRNGRAWVTEGPLSGKESLIRKIDRHKRLAEIRLPGTGGGDRFRKICAGLEIVEKT